MITQFSSIMVAFTEVLFSSCIHTEYYFKTYTALPGVLNLVEVQDVTLVCIATEYSPALLVAERLKVVNNTFVRDCSKEVVSAQRHKRRGVCVYVCVCVDHANT